MKVRCQVEQVTTIRTRNGGAFFCTEEVRVRCQDGSVSIVGGKRELSFITTDEAQFGQFAPGEAVELVLQKAGAGS